MLPSVFGKLGDFLNKLIGKKPISILSDTELASSIQDDDEELRSQLRQELNDYYDKETLTREYQTVILQRTRIFTDPSHVVLGKNEQLAARVHLVGIDGQKIEVDIFFKIGEKFSLDSFYKKIAGEMQYNPRDNISRSNYVRMATVESNFYVQTWIKK